MTPEKKDPINEYEIKEQVEEVVEQVEETKEELKAEIDTLESEILPHLWDDKILLSEELKGFIKTFEEYWSHSFVNIMEKILKESWERGADAAGWAIIMMHRMYIAFLGSSIKIEGRKYALWTMVRSLSKEERNDDGSLTIQIKGQKYLLPKGSDSLKLIQVLIENFEMGLENTLDHVDGEITPEQRQKLVSIRNHLYYMMLLENTAEYSGTTRHSIEKMLFSKETADGKMEHDIQLIKEYLGSLKDKSREDIQPHSRVWILAVQVALKNIGYDVGKIDGELGPITKTKIKEFQAANELDDDGLPGGETIKKILEHLDEINP